jgi:hypothetical protein
MRLVLYKYFKSTCYDHKSISLDMFTVYQTLYTNHMQMWNVGLRSVGGGDFGVRDI